MKYKNDLRRKNSGTLNGIDTMTLSRARVGTLSRNTYYKYKKELFEQLAQQSTTRFAAIHTGK